MKQRLAVLTSGGDAPGMNAAVRAVVRAGLDSGAEVYAIHEGFKGMIKGGEHFRRMDWYSMGGILQRGGTIIGTARSQAFKAREGRLKAVANLVGHGIDKLVVIGGDGSLTGADLLKQEWTGLLDELVAAGTIPADNAAAHPFLALAGLVGSIDNDMYGTDMTIGADTALHRITDAIDAISSTAASHQRAFVVEVMGRRCGYLAVMGALATGAEWALIPENPPDRDEWVARMCDVLREGVRMGRRDNIVVVAEGAIDQQGNPITCHHVAQVLEQQLGEDARITVLGHVQRGGSPSAYDRILATVMGVEAVDAVLNAEGDTEACLVALDNNRIVRKPLMECVRQTQKINEAIDKGDFARALRMRSQGFREAREILERLVHSLTNQPGPGKDSLRIGILNAGGLAPGMNTGVRALVRLALGKGHIPLGIRRGIRGLIHNDVVELGWRSVNGWAPLGGSELGTSRMTPEGPDFFDIARTLETQQIDALMIVGGFAGYQAAHMLLRERAHFRAFRIPIVCIPTSIDNNLPGAEYSVGADSALNSITEVIDKIKQSAVATNRVFVVEVMGRYCGYLALMSALATGAERVYLHEEGVDLHDLAHDIAELKHGFRNGKRLGLVIRNEQANPRYTTDVLAALLEEEGEELFDVRISILGHLQQGGNPSPFDRILAVRLAARALDFVESVRRQRDEESPVVCLGWTNGAFHITNLESVWPSVDEALQRPKRQWWMDLRPVARMLAKPEPDSPVHSILAQGEER